MIINSEENYCVGCLVRKIYKLHKSKENNNNFLKTNKGDKIINLNYGINNFKTVGIKMTSFLGKTDANDFTGHTLRRTGATEAAGSGLTIPELMLLGKWRTHKTMTGYLEKSTETIKTIQKKSIIQR